MARVARVALLAIAVVVGVLGALIVTAMALVQSGWAERRIERMAADRLGREVDLEGLRLRAAWPPQVSIDTLRVANPEWAQDRYLIDARGMRASVAPGALLRGQLVVTAAVEDAAASLEKRNEVTTWAFGSEGEQQPANANDSSEPKASRLSVRSVSIGAARVTYRDLPDETELVLRAAGELGREGRPFEARAEGRLRNVPLQLSVQAPAVPLGGEPVQVSFEGHLGENRAAGQTALRAAADALQSIQGKVEASGPSVAALNQVVGAELPPSAPYRVAAQFRHEGARWIVEDLQVGLGRSDLQGSASLEARRERPFLQATLASRRFDLQETGIKPKVKKEVEENTYLLPRDPWPTDKWDLLDAQIELYMNEIHNARPVPLDALELRVVLEDSALRVDPIAIRLAGGSVRGRLELDAAESPESGSVFMDLRGLRLSRLVPAIEKQKAAALGRMNGRVELAGRGATPAELMGSADGRLLFAAERGTASALLVEILGLDAAEAVTLLGKKREDPLRCAVMDLAVKGGTAKTSTFVIDASDTVLSVEGSADLGKERLALTARAEPRDASPFTLRTPVDISGTFLDPVVRPKPGPLATRAVAAAALAAINPLLALIPFVDPGGDPEGGCQPQKK